MSLTMVRDEHWEDPVKLSPDQLVSSSKLGKNLGSYLNQTRREPVFVTRGQEVEAVLVHIEEYRTLLEHERRAEETYYAALGLRRLFELHLAGGKTISLDEVARRFGVILDENDEESDDHDVED